MLNFDVDVIADDFNMLATMRFLSCSVRMATSLPLLAAHHYWALVGPTRDMRIAWAFICMPKLPFGWFVQRHGCFTFTNEQFRTAKRDQGAHHPHCMHLVTTNDPGDWRARRDRSSCKKQQELKDVEQSKNDKRAAIREEGGDEVIQMIGANEGYRKFFEGGQKEMTLK